MGKCGVTDSHLLASSAFTVVSQSFRSSSLPSTGAREQQSRYPSPHGCNPARAGNLDSYEKLRTIPADRCDEQVDPG